MSAQNDTQRTPRRQIHEAFAWDDLNTVLAVSRSGSLSAAARTLGVNHSTVSRRLAALEKATGHPLFRGLPRGHSPTAAGEELIKAAIRMEAEVLRLDQLLGSRRVELTGTVRLTAPDDIASQLLLQPLARFRALYPSIALEIISENRMLNLAQREADVALRCTNDPPDYLIGRRIAVLKATVYAARALAGDGDAAGALSGSLRDQPWIGWEATFTPSAFAAWIDENCSPDAVVYRTNSISHQFAAAKAGLGLALLPCFLGDSTDQLVRLRPPPERVSTALWLLTHRDLKDTPRVAALTDLLFRDLKDQMARLDRGFD